MRTALLALAVVSFAGLGLVDLLNGQVPTGVASLLLAVVNALLLAP